MPSHRDQFQVCRVDTGRIALNIREAGSGRLAIFLHGITALGAVWDPVLTRLKDTFRVVAVDQRGHGLSDKPASGYRADDFSLDALSLIEALGQGPALIVGHSLGARNGVVAATLRPDLVSGVVAIDFTPFIEREALDQLEARVNGGDRTFASREDVEAYLRNRYVNLPADAVSRRAEYGYRAEGDGFRPLADPHAMTQTASGLREDLEPAFREVARPVLIVRGAESRLVSESALEKTRQLRPDLPTLVVEGADHYVPEEAPEAIADAVLRFADAHP